MNERYPSRSATPDEGEQSLTPDFSLGNTSVENAFVTRNADGENIGGVFVKKDKAEELSSVLNDEFISESRAEAILASLEGLSEQEKKRIEREIKAGKEVVHIVLENAESKNGKSKLIRADVIANGERVGGGGKLFSQERQENGEGFSAGTYIPMKALESLRIALAGAGDTPVIINGAPTPETQSPDEPGSDPDDNPNPHETPERVLKTTSSVDEKEVKEKRKKRWLAVAGAAALAATLFNVFGSSTGDDATAREVAKGASLSEEVFSDGDKNYSLDLTEPAVVEVPAIEDDQGLVSVTPEVVDVNQYAFPWNWAAEQFGEEAAETMLHDLGSKAEADGHEVVWYTTDAGENVIQIDGVDATAPVITILNQYR